MHFQGNEMQRKMLQKLSFVLALVLAVITLMSSFTPAANADVITPSGTPQELVDPNEVRVTPEAVTDGSCDRGYLCVFQNANFSGRRLQFNVPGEIDLTDYGFNDQMSSWWNNSNVDAKWFFNTGGYGNPLNNFSAHCMKASTKNAYVGSGDNDQASSVELYTDNRAC